MIGQSITSRYYGALLVICIHSVDHVEEPSHSPEMPCTQTIGLVLDSLKCTCNLSFKYYALNIVAEMDSCMSLCNKHNALIFSTLQYVSTSIM